MSSFLQTVELDPQLDVLETLKAFEDAPFVLLLDSAARHREQDARFSFLTADPVEICRLDHVPYGDRPFQVLREWQTRFPNLNEGDGVELPPFLGGIAGLMSYEFGEAFEQLPSPAVNDFNTPAMLAGLFDWAIVWDHIAGTVKAYVLQLNTTCANTVTQNRMEWIARRFTGLTERSGCLAEHSGVVAREPMRPSSRLHQIEPSSEIYSDFTRDEYTAAVKRVVDYISAGDIFQANLSQRLLTRWSGTASQLYSRVRASNPAPFCGLLRNDDFAIVSASPERFLKVDSAGIVETRPIKGTRRRPRSPIADLFAGEELATSEKDRAENVMIVDLLRNDISRNCCAGSVKVTGLCEVERFETVLHLVSTVTGQLRPDRDVWDLMSGCFPGGSITGAPKIRAMQIISELEPAVRGAYCGSLFAWGPRGDFDSSILIRTFTLKDGWVQFPVGGGVVADSDPLDEYRETLHKASGMIRTLRTPVV